MILKTIFSFLILAFVPVPGLADDGKLWPTMLESLGDCVTPRISAPSNAAQEKASKASCERHNAGDQEKIAACIENSRMETVDFFTDRCAEKDGVYYISLDGTDYTLNRVAPSEESPVMYAGKFSGEGVEVEIKSGKLLSREMTPPEEGDPAEVMSEEYAVDVTVSKDGQTRKIEGVFWQGR